LGKRHKLTLHAVLLVVEPPSGTKLNFSNDATLLEAVHDGCKNFVIAWVQAVQNCLGKLVGDIQTVEKTRKFFCKWLVFDGVETCVWAKDGHVSGRVVTECADVVLLYPSQTVVLTAQVQQNVALVLLYLLVSKLFAGKCQLYNFVHLFLGGWSVHNNVQSMVGAQATNTIEKLDAVCKRLAKGVDTINLDAGNFRKLCNVWHKGRKFDVDCLVRTESRLNFYVEGLVLSKKLVPM